MSNINPVLIDALMDLHSSEFGQCIEDGHPYPCPTVELIQASRGPIRESPGYRAHMVLTHLVREAGGSITIPYYSLDLTEHPLDFYQIDNPSGVMVRLAEGCICKYISDGCLSSVVPVPVRTNTNPACPEHGNHPVTQTAKES